MKPRSFLVPIAIASFLVSCTGPEITSSTSRSTAAPERSQYAEAPRDRPGLGTKWGETRESRVKAAMFDRASKQPLAIAAIHYNDAAGIRAMAGAVDPRRQWPLLRAPAGNLVSVGLRDQSGNFLPGLTVGDRWFVVGEEGRRYSIVVRNRSELRLEVVLSVDGLDVMDGRAASFRKRGYIIEPHRQLVVEGFRQSTDAVAAFRFGPVRESYAQQKYGDTRNVGVVGIALFNERGTNPWTDPETRKRLNADPFPDRFATPIPSPTASPRRLDRPGAVDGAPVPLVPFSSPLMPKFFIKTYGCQMNERDSEQVAHSLLERGYERAEHEADADVVLLNTCSVRDMAEQKALGKMGMLGQIAKRRAETVFGFLGCMAQARGDSLFAAAPHLDLVVGTQKFHRVADYVEEALEKKRARRMDDPRFSICDTEEESGSADTIRDHELKERQATAFVSIMQGCNMHCTFCIVPRTRGPERSRSIGEIEREVRGLVSRGVKEVTLLGQIVNLYGRHEFPAIRGKSPFVQLLEAVHAIDGLERLRFTSPHPIGFRDDLLRALAELPKLAEHVHLPLQSGSDRILKAMHRPYTADKYRSLVRRIRETRPEIAITTDVIVGFPGEEEDDYQLTRNLVEELQFDNAFVFRYSMRQETPAASMPQIDERLKEERNQDLLKVVDASAQRINAGLVGRDLEILCEGPSRTNKSRMMGRTRTNKVVVFAGKPDHAGEILDIHVEEATGFSLYGTPVMQPSSPVFA